MKKFWITFVLLVLATALLMQPVQAEDGGEGPFVIKDEWTDQKKEWFKPLPCDAYNILVRVKTSTEILTSSNQCITIEIDEEANTVRVSENWEDDNKDSSCHNISNVEITYWCRRAEPTPTSTSTPTVTNTPDPTATPTGTPTDTPEPTATVTTTNPPDPTPTGTRASTPTVTATKTKKRPKDTPTPGPTATLMPTPEYLPKTGGGFNLRGALEYYSAKARGANQQLLWFKLALVGWLVAVFAAAHLARILLRLSR
jgi:hypothetical protein